MINVIMGNNVDRDNYIVDEGKTLKAALEENNIPYDKGVMYLDGASLNPGDLNKTFKDLGYSGEEGHNKCTLISVVKADNAIAA